MSKRIQTNWRRGFFVWVSMVVSVMVLASVTAGTIPVDASDEGDALKTLRRDYETARDRVAENPEWDMEERRTLEQTGRAVFSALLHHWISLPVESENGQALAEAIERCGEQGTKQE